MVDTVDRVRLIKPNKRFYARLVTLFIKFREANLEEFSKQDLS